MSPDDRTVLNTILDLLAAMPESEGKDFVREYLHDETAPPPKPVTPADILVGAIAPIIRRTLLDSSFLDSYESFSTSRLEVALQELARVDYELSQLRKEHDRYLSGCRICGAKRCAEGLWLDGRHLKLCAHCEKDLFQAIDGDWERTWRRRDWSARSRDLQKMRSEQVVYFAQWADYCKIGISVRPSERVRSFGLAGCKIVASESGGLQRETSLHSEFADLRVPPEELPAEVPFRREWFRWREPLTTYVASLSEAA